METQNHQVENIDEYTDSSITQFLTFRLHDNVYGINILDIKEIIDYGAITRVPMMPEFIAGVINLRGSVVPVVDLALRFSEKPSVRTKRSSIIIVEIDDQPQKQEIGITVDAVNRVLDLGPGEMEPAPAFGTKIRTDFISGVGKLEGRMLVLLDVGNLLSIAELSAVE